MSSADATQVEARLKTHEAVCAERYGTITEKLSTLQGIIKWSAATLLTGMAGIIIVLVTAIVTKGG